MAVPSLAAERDRLLAERCVAGDRNAQRELFRTHRQRVHATLFRVLGSNGPLDDLLQEAFLNVFRSLKTYRGESTLSTWIDRCTVRVAYQFISERKGRPPFLELVADSPVAAGGPSAEERTLAREAVRRFYDMLAKMDPKLRVAFTLHVVDGRPLRDVAELMDASLVATKTRVWRARRHVEERARKDPTLAPFVMPAGIPGVASDDPDGPSDGPSDGNEVA
jgi:RNA polymerase sigma-70 factor (ECF subfamily)